MKKSIATLLAPLAFLGFAQNANAQRAQTPPVSIGVSGIAFPAEGNLGIGGYVITHWPRQTSPLLAKVGAYATPRKELTSNQPNATFYSFFPQAYNPQTGQSNAQFDFRTYTESTAMLTTGLGVQLKNMNIFIDLLYSARNFEYQLWNQSGQQASFSKGSGVRIEGMLGSATYQLGEHFHVSGGVGATKLLDGTTLTPVVTLGAGINF